MSDPIPVLDRELLAKMSTMNTGAKALDEFALGLVLASAASRLEQMRAALQQPDALASVAHAFKGVSGTCGLRYLAAALESVEHTARQGLDAGVAMREAENAVAQTLQAIHVYLDRKRNPIQSEPV